MRIVLSIAFILAGASLCPAQNPHPDPPAPVDINPEPSIIATGVNMNAHIQMINSLMALGKPIELFITDKTCASQSKARPTAPPTQRTVPSKSVNTLDAIHRIISGNPELLVSEGNGAITIATRGVIPDVLKTRIAHLQFSEIDRDNPDEAMATLMKSAEVKDAEHKLNLSPETARFERLLAGLNPYGPRLPRSNNNLTAQEVIAKELLIFPGVAVYEECKKPDGTITFDYDYFRHDMPQD